MIKRYYIEDLDVTPKDDDSTGAAHISCNDHQCCITVYGDRQDLTERVIAVVKGLNDPANQSGGK